MDITFADISRMIGQFWWPFFRVGTVFISMPFFGDALIPVWVRSLLALSIVVVAAPLMPAMPAVDLFHSHRFIWLLSKQFGACSLV